MLWKKLTWFSDTKRAGAGHGGGTVTLVSIREGLCEKGPLQQIGEFRMNQPLRSWGKNISDRGKHVSQEGTW